MSRRPCIRGFVASVAGLPAVLGVAILLGAVPTKAQSIAWEQHDGYRDAKLNVSGPGRTGFTQLRPEETGVAFTNRMSYARAEANQNLMNGSGVAAGDFDGDGLCDLYFGSTEGGNGLFRNRGGWKFENVTGAAGVNAENQSTKGVVFADIDGDGRLDLLVNALGGPNAVFHNLGGGRFTNVTASAGIAAKAGGHSLALADIDGDGDLDLYLVNYGELSILRSGGQFSVRQVNGRPTVTGRWAKRLRLVGSRLVELGEPDVLYLNDGHGVFRAASWTGGTFLNADGTPLKTEPWDMGLSAQFRDLNQDGLPDLYVCNDFQGPDRIWMNDGQGHFRALADLAVRTTAHFSMGVDFADIDRDGHDDFFVGDMLSASHLLRMTQMNASNPPPEEVTEVVDRQQARRNSLNVARGDGTYSDLANFAGVDATDWTWAVAFVDVDLDGYEDLLTVNGHAFDTLDLDAMERTPTAQGSGMNRQIGKNLHEFPPLVTPNFAFHNNRDRTFKEVGRAWGFNATNVCHGLAFGDFDNDGDLDVAVSCLNAPPLLYRNESIAPRVAIRLKGAPPNTQGIGARIRLRGGAVPDQSQEIQAGGRYLSADEPMRVFAARANARDMTLEVRWRSGRLSTVTNVQANRIYEIDEAGARPAPASPLPANPPPLFREVTPALAHAHAEQAFDESARQSLLYRSLERLGPAIAWIDLDGDGRDELVVGGSVNTPSGIYRRDVEKNTWQEWRPSGVPAVWPVDTAGLAATTIAGGTRALLVAASTYRPGQDLTGDLHQLSAAGWNKAAAGGLQAASAGPIAVADIDGDGDLDVFVGGRVIPGHYPDAATSQLWRNEGGQLTVDATNSAGLKNVGLVVGAVWSDLDDDGYPELILTCEWGPVRVFQNARGQLTEATTALGLAAFTGWWQGINTADIDGDGRLDLIVANWGWNSSYHRPSPTEPAIFYHGDLDDNGTADLLETEWADGRLWPRRNLAALRDALPGLSLKYSSHRAFAAADMPAVLGEHAARARKVEAVTFASTVFLRRGDRFEAVPLPDEAQHAPAYAVNVADADGDGREDVFLSQNCFAVRADEPRLDAGLGLWLRGEDRARAGHPSGLQPLRPLQSGVRVHGQQRGAALSDFDGDGRVDLAVAQNDGPTILFHNEAARPGIRVRLAGPAGNSDGIGARIRLKFAHGFGAPRELKAGSGYWCQDSLVAVLATPSAPESIEVRWPGGNVTTGNIPNGAAEVRMSIDGRLTTGGR